MTGKQEFPLRMAEGEMSWHAAVCRAALFAMGAAGSGRCAGLTLDNATSGALDADQVTEADVVGGDVVSL